MKWVNLITDLCCLVFMICNVIVDNSFLSAMWGIAFAINAIAALMAFTKKTNL